MANWIVLLLALVKKPIRFIEIPVFEESMYLAISADHSWAQREQVGMSELSGQQLY